MLKQKDDITVSIICITYNHGEYIEETLKGFIKQAVNFKFEIIIHDDASTDQTVEIIKKYKSMYPNLFKVIFQTHNQYSVSVNIPLQNCFSIAVGRYIAFCEGDDFWIDENKLQKQVDFLDANPSYGLVFTDFNILYQKKDITQYACFKTNPAQFPLTMELAEFILARSYMAPCTWLMRREHMYRPIHEALDSTFCWLIDVLSVSKIHFINDVTTVYRVLEESASHSRSFDKILKRENDILYIQNYYCHLFGLDNDISHRIYIKHLDRVFHLHIALKNRVEIKSIRSNFKRLSLRTKMFCIISFMPFSSKIISLLYNYKNK